MSELSELKVRNGNIFQIGNKYAELDGIQVEPIIVRFFGIFFLFFQFTFVVGSAISSAGKSTVQGGPYGMVG